MLERIQSAAKLRELNDAELVELAAEIRNYLVNSVSQTGGHLGPNLGVVELSIALHRVFDSPHDPIVFDTGHQSYVHKLLTGRSDLSTLRTQGGISGYPSRAESEHDIVENSHASTAISWAAGIARAHAIRGEADRTTVAVIGDGALTGGMAWEALNSISETDDRVVVVVNDNGRSYAPTTGGLARKLDLIRTTQTYEQILTWGKRNLSGKGGVRSFAFQTVTHAKRALKGLIANPSMFEDLGIKYLGPIDGHNLAHLEIALAQAREFGAPVIVHVITEKGRGYSPAEQDVQDRFHAVGKIHPETGLPIEPSRFGWTSVFADEMLHAGATREDIVGITAAMLAPVGLQPFAEAYPERTIDVGIAEQHAVTAAAGLAYAGMHPVFAVYATFLNRAFDQLLLDAALHRAGITIMLDRAGITGDDGPSHNGMWDLALLQHVPNIRIAAPRDEDSLRIAFREAIDVSDRPTVVRYPKGALAAPLPAIAQVGELDILASPDTAQVPVLIIGLGPFAQLALDTAEMLAATGIPAKVATATWVHPVPAGLAELASAADLVVTLEDGLIEGGIGQNWAAYLRAERIEVPVRNYGVRKEFLEHASRAQILTAMGLTPTALSAEIQSVFAQH